MAKLYMDKIDEISEKEAKDILRNVITAFCDGDNNVEILQALLNEYNYINDILMRLSSSIAINRQKARIVINVDIPNDVVELIINKELNRLEARQKVLKSTFDELKKE